MMGSLQNGRRAGCARGRRKAACRLIDGAPNGLPPSRLRVSAGSVQWREQSVKPMESRHSGAEASAGLASNGEP